MTKLPQKLKMLLARPLPGRLAQRRFEPELGFGRHFHAPPRDARQAAVTLLLYPRGDEWLLPMVLRPATLTDHAGQIGFPGGTLEPGEESAVAALRELYEELGVSLDQIELLGPLSPINLFVSNFAVMPWVACVPSEPAWRPNATEVAEVLQIPLAHLTDRANWGTYTHRRFGVTVAAPCIQWQGHSIWGASALILGEFIAVLEAAGEWGT